MNVYFNKSVALVAGAILGSVAGTSAFAGENQTDVFTSAAAGAGSPALPAPPPPPGQPGRLAQTFTYQNKHRAPVEKIWLGVGVDETSEPLTDQLGLKPGEGLVVTYISTNSPAAAAGIRKNDVLVELDGQMLVDPVQLRKLVQMHAEGDSVKIEFYHAGKKQSATAKLVKRAPDELGMDEERMPGEFGNTFFRFGDGTGWGGNGAKFNVELQQTMKNAQQAVQDALKQSFDGSDGLNHKLETLHQRLGNLADGGVKLGKKATVVVKNEGASVRTMVKKDEAGTYVIVADPAKHLTVHDASGKLLFDGPIDSPEQQQKVPADILNKVTPMLEQMDKEPSPGHKLSRASDPEEN